MAICQQSGLSKKRPAFHLWAFFGDERIFSQRSGPDEESLEIVVRGDGRLIHFLCLRRYLPDWRSHRPGVSFVGQPHPQLANRQQLLLVVRCRRDVLLLRQCTKDRKSTRLNSSHLVISYAVFCLKKKKKNSQCTLHRLRHKARS